MRPQFRHLFPAFLFLCLLLSSIAYAQQRGVKRVEIKTQTGELIGLYEQSHALVIGVSDYTAGWRRLRGVKDDVLEVSEALQTSSLIHP
jgi:hypothetical protein